MGKGILLLGDLLPLSVADLADDIQRYSFVRGHAYTMISLGSTDGLVLSRTWHPAYEQKGDGDLQGLKRRLMGLQTTIPR